MIIIFPSEDDGGEVLRSLEKSVDGQKQTEAVIKANKKTRQAEKDYTAKIIKTNKKTRQPEEKRLRSKNVMKPEKNCGFTRGQ